MPNSKIEEIKFTVVKEMLSELETSLKGKVSTGSKESAIQTSSEVCARMLKLFLEGNP